MQLMYVVELRVDAAKRGGSPDPESLYERILGHIVSWQTHEHPGAITRTMLGTSGSLALPAGEIGGERRLDWTVEGTDAVKCLQLQVRTSIRANGDADFVCVITAFHDDARAVLRLELGREVSSGVLAPTGVRFLRRPHLLVLLTRDPEIALWAGPNRVDGRFSWVNPKDTEDLWQELNEADRQLPILLVDAREEVGDSVAWRCAGELAGLASVRAVDARAQTKIGERLATSHISIPRGGACLVWPDLTLRHPSYGGDLAATLPSRLLRMLSSVSVPARGTNDLTRRAAAARRATRTQQYEEELREARAGGDIESEVEAQAARIKELQELEELWAAEIEALAAERDGLKSQGVMAAYWKEQAEAAWGAEGSESKSWADAPPLEVGSLEPLAEFLESQSGEAIVFTAAALRSWRKDKYPHMGAMHDALVKLAEAAVEYRRINCQFAMPADDWFKQVWGLNMATTDAYMTRNHMDKFDFEGDQHSRVPHLKLDDYVSPNEVGRVYFAMDSQNQRFIVDHAGLKLYGL